VCACGLVKIGCLALHSALRRKRAGVGRSRLRPSVGRSASVRQAPRLARGLGACRTAGASVGLPAWREQAGPPAGRRPGRAARRLSLSPSHFITGHGSRVLYGCSGLCNRSARAQTAAVSDRFAQTGPSPKDTRMRPGPNPRPCHELGNTSRARPCTCMIRWALAAARFWPRCELTLSGLSAAQRARSAAQRARSAAQRALSAASQPSSERSARA